MLTGNRALGKTGRGWALLVSGTQIHIPVLLLSLTDVLHHNLNRSNSLTHTLKTVVVTEWSKARSLLGHQSTFHRLTAYTGRKAPN